MTPVLKSGTARRTLRVVAGVLLWMGLAAAWFLAAGRWNWYQGWLLLLGFVVFTTALALRLRRSDPELLRERNQPAGNVEAWDKVIIRLYTIFIAGLLFIAALDSGRFGWSRVPPRLQLLGWGLLMIAASVIWHVMKVNPFLSSWARLQDDRGQYVVTDGMYGHIRHPMYAGIMLAVLALPVSLGSWWAYMPGCVILGLFVMRTIREDLMLMRALDGYPEYAREVPYRLIPGIF
jgi:protein-S-isoprenylcysteine O-methyltransferase Ste14